MSAEGKMSPERWEDASTMRPSKGGQWRGPKHNCRDTLRGNGPKLLIFFNFTQRRAWGSCRDDTAIPHMRESPARALSPAGGAEGDPWTPPPPTLPLQHPPARTLPGLTRPLAWGWGTGTRTWAGAQQLPTWECLNKERNLI